MKQSRAPSFTYFQQWPHVIHSLFLCLDFQCVRACCMYVSRCWCTCVYVCGSQRSNLGVSHRSCPPFFFFLSRVSHWPTGLSVSASSVLGLQVWTSMHGFVHGHRGWNSGLHACMTLPLQFPSWVISLAPVSSSALLLSGSEVWVLAVGTEFEATAPLPYVILALFIQGKWSWYPLLGNQVGWLILIVNFTRVTHR